MTAQTSFYTRLPKRGLITLSGTDRKAFLQDLVTNDVNLLDTQGCVYACLLSPQGKFMHDFFTTEENDNLFLDCEGGERALHLAKVLKMYALRADVTFDAQESTDIYAVIGQAHGHKDPRHENIGYRSFDKPTSIDEKPFEEWDHLRISLTLPDGSRDLIIGKSTMDEGNMDQINAIDYNKGCYVGQEITARMHYRGLGKRRLQTVNVNTLPEKAELRSSCGEIGIALVRV